MNPSSKPHGRSQAVNLRAPHVRVDCRRGPERMQKIRAPQLASLAQCESKANSSALRRAISPSPEFQASLTHVDRFALASFLADLSRVLSTTDDR